MPAPKNKKSSTPRKTAKTTRSSGTAARAKNSKELLDLRGQIAAIHQSQAVIEFELDGTILNANDNFLNAMGYSLEEVVGRHHQMFVDNQYAASAEYQQFWQSLAAGNFRADEFKRFGKHGREVWIQATYNPILDAKGNPFKVVKYATDITESKIRNADYEGQLRAINKSQAVIEFNLDGTILNANDNFLAAVGYQLSEIQGQHHRIFVDPVEAASEGYREFWNRLNRGEFAAGEYRRYAKNGDEVWIQASYNPIMDADGKPAKVVKFATGHNGDQATRKSDQRIRGAYTPGSRTPARKGRTTPLHRTVSSCRRSDN